MIGLVLRVMIRLALQTITKKVPWLGAILGWLWTDTPVGGAIDDALTMFTSIALPVGIAALCAWLWLRARDARVRDRLLDLHLPQPPSAPAVREDVARDPDVDPRDVEAVSAPTKEGARA